MLIKTVLNKFERFKSFIYGDCRLAKVGGSEALVIDIKARRNSKPECPECGKRGKTYDTQPARLFEYVPIWAFKVFFRYAPRRVLCPIHGVKVESLPWGYGKEQMTISYQVYLARWARRLSWKEVAEIFKTSWDSIFRAVQYAVDYGLANRNLDGVTEIGVDEIAVFKGHQYLTMVYQLNAGVRRLLWCGPQRRIRTLLRFFREFGKERSAKLKYVCSDMWAPYLKVIAKRAPNAVNILDRFHIMRKFNEAIDEVRRTEAKEFKAAKQENVLEKGRWLLLKRPENLSEKQTSRLGDLLKLNLSSIKAYLLREDFQQFWDYQRSDFAGKFLDDWVIRTMQTDLEPMKKVARMLRNHKPMILNWFKAKGRLSSGAVEGLNLKAKLTIRKAYGFRTIKCLQVALYHTLGDLPEPLCHHRFC
ncbi:transposase IS204/IS1001/IS1096/IS1165 family protein [Geobacter metallireducens RCH3]|uniref:Transposase of ISGme6, ISL3 family n=1 Tax=Geobacter metallireducens (strain ATCC 53774 / DSM 7210 / GS-15) TaxID=269799 RepID=Q39Z50_GEOMG|nr:MULTISPECIES: ISL3-like element ISGme6 family transposase [Geobacter]ABB30330.1 transposase of ISGme6, ISL3 family [Geobacter metallireducens GS-15]ABB30474.1 transposase of ISGme6, ISL3 family [Geobacter metallireducens GS-15]ABB31244.1 transposase of ISGme6, ISL3 family [Geobacter metallireducens GS-15]ABB31568.1 transposase of ISGme6, ISL3 family [Geobacter metallireducens GS-15]ABB31632.1 transposase of ISGme6, ISL3 family [Geobacter metallireducens GS-15]